MFWWWSFATYTTKRVYECVWNAVEWKVKNLLFVLLFVVGRQRNSSFNSCTRIQISCTSPPFISLFPSVTYKTRTYNTYTKRTRAGNSNSFLHERLENEFSALCLLNHAVVEQSSSFLLVYRHRGETRRWRVLWPPFSSVSRTTSPPTGTTNDDDGFCRWLWRSQEDDDDDNAKNAQQQ